ncbi:hypothetical protein BH11ACT3_BH11ACT3_09730 [soil metagenome]
MTVESPPAAPAEPTLAPTRPKRVWKAGDWVLLGIVVLLVLGLLATLALTALVAARNAQTAQSRIGATISVDDLVPGDCISEFDRVGGSLNDFPLTSCDSPHAAELIAVQGLRTGSDDFLGANALSDLARSICQTTFDFRLHMTDVSDYPTAFLFGVYSTRTDPVKGATQFRCFLINRDGSPLVGQFYSDQTLN